MTKETPISQILKGRKLLLTLAILWNFCHSEIKFTTINISAKPTRYLIWIEILVKTCLWKQGRDLITNMGELKCGYCAKILSSTWNCLVSSWRRVSQKQTEEVDTTHGETLLHHQKKCQHGSPCQSMPFGWDSPRQLQKENNLSWFYARLGQPNEL